MRPPRPRRHGVPVAERGPGWSYRPAEAEGLLGAGLTVTNGLGARAFARVERPVALRPLPAFVGDRLMG